MKRIALVILLASLVLSGCRAAGPAPAAPGVATAPGDQGPGKDRDWPVSDPAAEGMDAAKLEEMRGYVDGAVADGSLRLDSLLIVRGGKIVFEQYYRGQKADTQHEMFSVTKSFTAALLAVAYDLGDFEGVDMKVVDALPGREFANMDERKAAMTVEDLLTMASGLDWKEGDPAYNAMYRSSDWVKTVMDLPMVADPGERFNYCSGCSHVLSAIVREAVGGKESAFAREVLFDPLGIKNYRWEEDPRGTLIGGWGLWLTSRDMARFGYLFLHNGIWEGKQVIPHGWVEASLVKHQPDSGRLDYGYQWWVARKHGAFAALGRGGQMIYVDPTLDLIVVTTADLPGNHDPVLDLVEDYIEPAASPK